MPLQQDQQPSARLGKNEPVLTVKQVAEQLHIDQSTIYEWLNSGRLRGYNMADPGKRAVWRIDERDLATFMEARVNDPTPEEPEADK